MARQKILLIQTFLLAAVLVTSFQNCGPMGKSALFTDPSVDNSNGNPSPGTNQDPVVNAGLDKSLTLPTNSVSLTATASDPDGQIVTVQWIQISGPTQATLAGNSSLTLMVSNLSAGDYVFRFAATDDGG